MEAKINISYRNTREAMAIARAVAPDNMKVPTWLSIRTTVCGVKVSTKITCHKRFESFASTIDDLLSAVSVAEKSLAAVKRH